MVTSNELKSYIKFQNEIYHPIININESDKIMVTPQNITLIDDYVLLFNNHYNIGEYSDFMQEIVEDFKSETAKLIKKSKSKHTVLLNLNQIALDLNEMKDNFNKLNYSNLSEIEQSMKIILGKSGSKMPVELNNEQITQLNNNINIVYSEEFIQQEMNKDEYSIAQFVDGFVSVQINTIKEIEKLIVLFITFLKDIPDDVFKNKSTFREHEFFRNSISEEDMNRKMKPKNPNAISSLDIKQSVLLYQYMEKAGLYIEYKTNKDKAFLLSRLTGYSEQNLRTDNGFAQIGKIKDDRSVVKPKNIKSDHYNLDSVKEALKNVIELIDNEIKEMFPEKNT